ncbi:MAG: hypothetical protein E7653_00300 [Ruminococcaceae bacterium]|nr:hypothetical protein [Oscillospiraceae bacterium]
MKVLKRILVIVLCVALLVTSLVGCSSRGKKLMELEKSNITVNMFMLLMSRTKGNLAAAYGDKVNTEAFWDTVIDASTGKTYNDYYKEQVLQSAKTYLACLYLFDELDLKLPDSYIDEIDAELAELIEYDANGSKAEFNSMLSSFGANYKILREAYIMEAKISYLNDYLFGATGEKIATDLYEDYYQQNYVRFKHVFFYTMDIAYVEDENGDDVYFTSEGRVAYDKENGTKKQENGAVVKDVNGDIIFITSDGKIAYDKENGTRKAQTDSKGNAITEKLSSDEIIAISDKATLMTESVKKGDYQAFDALVSEYSEDEGTAKYTNGYYLTRTSDYIPAVRDALFDMEVGEVRKIVPEGEDAYGIHVVMKYELDKGGYAEEANGDFFRASDGSYNFLSNIKQELLADYIDKYISQIVIDEKLLSTVSMKSVKANYHY